MRGRALLAAIALTGAMAGCSGSPAPAAPGIQVFPASQRQAAPGLAGDLLDGSGTFDLAAHRGDVIVVNFWAQWCGPCVAEADDLENTYQATKADHVTFLGVNTRDERDKAKRFVVGRATYPSVFDPAGKLALGFAVPPTSIPATIIIDRQGRIAAIARGAVVQSALEPVVDQLAAENKSG
jgi:thiol-disulfide isomerase/thioredoxin